MLGLFLIMNNMLKNSMQVAEGLRVSGEHLVAGVASIVPETAKQGRKVLSNGRLLREKGLQNVCNGAALTTQIFKQIAGQVAGSHHLAKEILRENLAAVRKQIGEVNDPDQRRELREDATDLLNRLERETENYRQWMMQFAILSANVIGGIGIP